MTGNEALVLSLNKERQRIARFMAIDEVNYRLGWNAALAYACEELKRFEESSNRAGDTLLAEILLGINKRLSPSREIDHADR